MAVSVRDYRYSPLQIRHIRVLQLEGDDAPIGNMTTLQGTLRQISLDNAEPFDAISYVWGASEFSKCILLDGEAFWLIPNCYSGLRHLRDHFNVRTIWVDSICINQGDSYEKGGQIPLMREIYGKARRVYIWLGESSGDNVSDHAMNWLQDVSVSQFPLLGVRLSIFPMNMHPRLVRRALRVIPEVIKAEARRWGLRPPRAQYDHEAMIDILGREWFKRMWTIQELVMAEEPVVVCGAKAIRWNSLFWGITTAFKRADDRTRDDFSAILDSLLMIYRLWMQLYGELGLRESAHRQWVAEDSGLFKSWNDFLDFMEEWGALLSRTLLAVSAVIVMIRCFQGLRPLDSNLVLLLLLLCLAAMILTPPPRDDGWDDSLREWLVTLLNYARNQQSTEPKDKVYALYGMLQSMGIRLPQPNYSTEYRVEDAYLEFTVSIIQWKGSLDIFLEASGPWGSNAPSWVPDWNRCYKRLRLPDARASGGRMPRMTRLPCIFSENYRELTVLGKRVGKVVFRAGSMGGPSRLGRALGNPVSSFQSRQHISNDIVAVTTSREWLQAVVETFNLSIDRASELLASITLQSLHTDRDFYRWAEIILQDDVTIERDEILRITSTLVSELDGEVYGDNPSSITHEIYSLARRSVGPEYRILLALARDEALWRLHRSLSLLLAETMTLFVVRTSDSFLLGMGPRSIQANDVVALLSTLGAPLIVRVAENAGGKYQAVGAAHIDGLMRGELWPEVDAEVESITFV